jgi:polysaccharide pyruvyl transferase CsaB
MPGEPRSIPLSGRIFISGYYGFGNSGDEAILASLLADLRALRPDLDFTVASGDPAGTARDHGVRAVHRDDLPAVAAAIRESGLVILGGGGLFEDYWEVPLENVFTPRSGGLPFYAGFALLAALLDTPAMLYAVGAGPLRTEEGRRLTRTVFELAEGATVRDPESLALLTSLGAVPVEGIEVAADPAFGLVPEKGERLEALLAGLGLAPGERPVGVALRPWSFGADPGVWEAEVARGLDRFLEESGERLLFLPFQGEEDAAVHRRVHAALTARDRAILIEGPIEGRIERRLAPAEMAGLLGRCGRVLAMRYHAALFALAAGAPAAALAYDPKVRSLFNSAGLADLALPPEDWRAEAVAKALREARPPTAGFAGEMRCRAARSAARAVEILEWDRPAPSEARRLLYEMAVEKVLAAFRLETESGERGALIAVLRGEAAALQASLTQERETAQALLAQERETAQSLLARERETAQGLLAQERETAQGLLTQEREKGQASLAQEREKSQALEHERAGLREQRDLLLTERNDLDRRLSAFEQTLAYRLVSRFWRLTGSLFPDGSRRRKLYRLARRALGKLFGGPATPEAAWRAGMGGAPAPASAADAGMEPLPDPRADLLAFEERVRAGGAHQVVAIFSATQLLESEGQRPTQLALALSRRGVPVVFIYWRWWDNEWRPQDRLDDGIVQVPIDVVTRRPEMLTGAFEGLERIAFFEFPHPGFFETLSVAGSAGWITVYDVLDDWDEFHRVGQAIWYDEPFERHLIGASDAVFTINEVLAGRIRQLGGSLAEVVGNGLKPGLEVVGEPRPLERGEVTVGYFGYLAGAWFDWELVAAAARLRPSWRFYLIGYGGLPDGVELPASVALLGKQPQGDLAAYAANWDVALIPFKPDRLAAGADPIKTYEYLAMGLPVVATGVYPPAGGEAFVRRAEGAEGFVREIEQAAAQGRREGAAARRAFAASCTWDHRMEEMLDSIEQGRQRVAEKRALLGVLS